MDEGSAVECLTNRSGKKPSEIGQAVDVLYQVHGTHAKIVQQLKLDVGSSYLRNMRRIFHLPKGIRWKVDEYEIKVTQGYAISRLADEDDQWMLAITVVEKKLNAKECNKVVDIVLNKDASMRDALSTVTGVRFEEISPPVLLLPIGVDFWFALSKAAWQQGEEWQDLCYRIIRGSIDIDTKEVIESAESLRELVRKDTDSLHDLVREHAESLRKIADRTAHRMEELAAALSGEGEDNTVNAPERPQQATLDGLSRSGIP